MSNDPVAVVVPFSPAHTPDEFLQRAISSIENQTYPTEPVVVTDDEQRGPAWARNVGLERTDRRFVAFCDADDYWRETKIERQRERLEAEDQFLCLTQTVRKGSGETNVEPFDSAAEFAADVLLYRSLSFTSSMLVDTGTKRLRFDETLSRREDHLFALQAAAEGVCFLPDPLTVIHKHSDGLSKQDEAFKEQIESRRYFFEQAVEVFPHLETHESEYWHREYHGLGRTQYFQGNYDRSVDCLREALSHRFHHRTFAALLLSYLYGLVD